MKARGRLRARAFSTPLSLVSSIPAGRRIIAGQRAVLVESAAINCDFAMPGYVPDSHAA